MNNKSKYSYYHDFSDHKFSVCTNFVTDQFTIFRKQAYEKTLKYINQSASSNEDKRGYELLCEAGYFNLTNDEDQNFERKWNEVIEQEGMLSIVIFVTDKCNFRCRYCCQEHAVCVLSEETQEKLLLFLEKTLPAYKYFFVEWFGGEPLLYPEIIGKLSSAIISLCRKYNVHYQAHITTNGYLLNADMVRFLRKNMVLSYQITLDGIRASHNQQRFLKDGSGTWDRIINNLIEIRDHVHTSTISIMIRTNITTNIYKHRKEYLTFLKDTFSMDRRFHFLWKLAEDWGNIDQTGKTMLCGTKEYGEVVSMANEIGLKTRFLKNTFTLGGRMCEAGKKNYIILYTDGTIGKCARRLNPDMNTIGTVDDLLNKADEMLGIVLKSKKEHTRNCQHCVKLPLCLAQICPMESIKDCGYEMDNLDFMLESIALTDDRCIVKDN